MSAAMKTKPLDRVVTMFRPALWMAPAMALAVALASAPGCETTGGVADLRPAPVRSEPAAPVTFKHEPDIRVRVERGVSKKRISGPPQVVARQVGTSGKTLVLRTPVTVSSGNDGILAVDGAGTKHAWPFGSELEVLTTEADPLAPVAQSLVVDGARFPGFLTFRPMWNDRPHLFDLVVTMPIETYLPGVVTHELLPKWPRQTNEAQAVAARTYALHERGRNRAERRAYDVEATTADQVYGSFTAPVAVEAVSATRGMILTSEGKVLRAYFSSQCGGRPASAADVWPVEYPFNKARPLQGQPRQAYCQRSSLYRWEVTRRVDDVNQRLRAWGKANEHAVGKLSRVRSIEVLERNAAERPNKYRLTDDHGERYVLKAEELRNGLNHPVTGLAPITRENRIHSGDMEAEVWADQARFLGRGWGHGVGMCQWCAKGMADQGMDWRSMIETFYPGAEIVKAY
jgi:stage II sporulation protein D